MGNNSTYLALLWTLSDTLSDVYFTLCPIQFYPPHSYRFCCYNHKRYHQAVFEKCKFRLAFAIKLLTYWCCSRKVRQMKGREWDGGKITFMPLLLPTDSVCDIYWQTHAVCERIKNLLLDNLIFYCKFSWKFRIFKSYLREECGHWKIMQLLLSFLITFQVDIEKN